jgi:hypothetical protein
MSYVLALEKGCFETQRSSGPAEELLFSSGYVYLIFEDVDILLTGRGKPTIFCFTFLSPP